MGRKTIISLTCVFLALLCAIGKAQDQLEVFQNLEEITQRIPRLKEKPCGKLIDKNGFYQSEITIFKDIETGAEVWSLTREECTHLANIERRCPWSWNGRYASFIGNRKWRDAAGKLRNGGGTWPGHNYLVNADFSRGRKFFVSAGGKLQVMHNKFMTWDRTSKPILYFAVNNKLWRVTVGPGVADNKAEVIHTFPNAKRKILQNISDNRKLCIQDINGKNMQDMPNYYIVDLNKKPGEKGFVRTHTLGYGGMQGIDGHDPNNEYRVHGISINRDGKKVRWGYGSMTKVGEYVGFWVPSDNLNAKPTPRGKKQDEWDQYRSHSGIWLDGRSVYFSGGTKKITAAGGKSGWGLWVHVPGKVPVFTGRKCGGGHATWCGSDPAWWFAHVYNSKKTWVDKTVTDRIVTGTPDGNLKILCRPYDHRRGGKSGYDAIPRPNQSPDATKCWFHSSMLMSSDKYTGSFIVVHRRPHPPSEFSAKADAGGVRFSWKLHPLSNEVRGVNIFMKGPDAWLQLNAEPLAGKETVLKAPAKGIYKYMATCEEWTRLESDITSPVITLTVKNGKLSGGAKTGTSLKSWDKKAPTPVKNFKAEKLSDGFYKLTWGENKERDLRYYNIYVSSNGKPEPVQKRLLVSPPRNETKYLDWTAPKDKEVKYCIVAVDRQGNVSKPVYADATK